jgi:hypothetical protein
MKPPLLTILLLAPALAFGQKFQDVTAKEAPVSLLVKHDYADMGPYAAVSVKGGWGRGNVSVFSLVRSPQRDGVSSDGPGRQP